MATEFPTYATTTEGINAVLSVTTRAPATVTGTTDTLAAADNGRVNVYTNAALVTVTIPTDAADDLADGFECTLFADGAAGVVLDTAGITLLGDSPPSAIAQNEILFVKKTATANTWIVVGGGTNISDILTDLLTIDGVGSGLDADLLDGSQLTELTLNAATDVSGNSWVVDEDDMVSDDATKVPTQQSVKAYVDSSGGGSVSDDLALAAAGFGAQFVSGRYYGNHEDDGTVSATGKIVAAPFFSGPGLTIDRLAVKINTTTSTLGRVGIYDVVAGVPDSLLYEGPEVSVSATGDLVVTVSYTFAANTLFAIAFSADNTAAILAKGGDDRWGSFGPFIGSTTAFPATPAGYWFATSTYSTNLPSTFPATGLTLAKASETPAYRMRVA